MKIKEVRDILEQLAEVERDSEDRASDAAIGVACCDYLDALVAYWKTAGGELQQDGSYKMAPPETMGAARAVVDASQDALESTIADWHMNQ
ncbi:hypothetical protein M0R72_16730 [Candidatus Pacearchaeota archaeon]|jgi:hypothetical protein|nr:hypothetical protein [Candidatus Pacearchaeota archaeon]